MIISSFEIDYHSSNIADKQICRGLAQRKSWALKHYTSCHIHIPMGYKIQEWITLIDIAPTNNNSQNKQFSFECKNSSHQVNEHNLITTARQGAHKLQTSVN